MINGFPLKESIHKTHDVPTFKERDIWWCSIGVNVGSESDGKNKDCNRPVLVVRKFNRNMFWGVPLTTRVKDNPYYYKIRFHDKDQCAMISQLRLWDAKRMTHKMGRLPDTPFHGVRQALKGLL